MGDIVSSNKVQEGWLMHSSSSIVLLRSWRRVLKLELLRRRCLFEAFLGRGGYTVVLKLCGFD